MILIIAAAHPTSKNSFIFIFTVIKSYRGGHPKSTKQCDMDKRLEAAKIETKKQINASL